MQVARYSEAELPTAQGPFRLVVYRVLEDQVDSTSDREHMAIVCGEIRGKANMLCRVHSECWTSEVMGSLKCDCREQLRTAMERITAEGAGVVVYLRQEGRGIGLGNKVKAYALQNGGADTVEANLALGFEADARSYNIAGAILRDLGVQSVRLLTNNPLKVKGLEDAGVVVAARVPHWVGENQHNAEYLAVKRRKMGHHDDTDATAPAGLKATGGGRS
jgi:GTP cyclohydrolase II/3,4-dihydroxy 2-butanone 4-phosphate synthase/GTP cyclohydrolase II